MNEHVDAATAQAHAPAMPAVKTINLALQGGGAHGAFTWGVLDRLLEEERIAFEGISATSAGAMNAAVLAYGLTVGGREGAQAGARATSGGASRTPRCSARCSRRSSTGCTHNHGLENSPALPRLRHADPAAVALPAQPAELQPAARSVLEAGRRLRAAAPRLGRQAVPLGDQRAHRQGPDLHLRTRSRADAVLASACLPFLFQAVEIDGEAYWDGGYMGNPAHLPADLRLRVARTWSSSTSTRSNRPDVPTTARDIMNRINEISFNSSLMREMRAIAFVNRLIDDGKLVRRAR